MSEDAPRAPSSPARESDRSAAIAAKAARIRELERRAFARPRDPAAAADAAAAAAELAALRPPPPPSRVAPDSAADAADLDDDPDDRLDRTWLGSAAAGLRSRASALPREERRAIAIGAIALLALTGILIAAHAALTAPPPAFAVFDGERTAQRDATGQWDLADATVLNQLEGRGIDVVSGPVVFGEPSRDPRLVVYRQWVSDSIIEVCGGLVIDGAFLAGETCTSDRRFRAEGLVGAFVDGAYAVEFSWSPQGEPSLELVQRGAVTLEEVRELGIPALAALEAGPTPADELIWNYTPDTIAGPLLLAEVDGVQYVGLLAADDDSLGRLGDAPTFCLWVGDAQSNAGSCTSAETFAEEGLAAAGTSSSAGPGPRARWLPSGELVVGEP